MRKLGEALRQAVSEDFRPEQGAAVKSPLMNTNRRRVFEHVAWHPCATAGEIARALAVSEPTAAWHLRKLEEAGYVRSVPGPGGRSFVAEMLSLEDADIATLAALAGRDAPRILALAIRTPGLTSREIADLLERPIVRTSLRALQAAGLLVAVADGRYRRFFPGASIATLERTSPRRLRDFRRRLVRRLEHDRLAPEVRTAPGQVVEIDVRFGEERATLRLPEVSLLAGRLGQATLS